jgi:hypothetical protein
VTFRQANGLCYLLADGALALLGSRILFGRGKCLKMRQNPASQVYAVLGGSTSVFTKVKMTL